MNEKELYQLIETQAQEIAELKRSLQELRATPKTGEDIDVKAYFIKKYEEKYEEICNKRLTSVDQEIRELKNALLENEDNEKKQAQLVMENETIESKLVQFEEEIEKLYIEQEKNEFTYNEQLEKLKDKQSKLENNLFSPWQKLYDAIKNIKINNDYQKLVEEISNLKEFAQKDEGDLVGKFEKIGKDLEVLTKGFEEKQKEISSKIESLQIEKDKGKKGIHPLSIHEITTSVKELKQRLIQKEQYRKDLFALLKSSKVEQIKEIEDAYLNLKVLEKTRKEVAEGLEQIVLEKCQQLNRADTPKNLIFLKEERQKELTLKLEKLEALQNEKNLVETEYTELQNKFVNVRKSINEIEEYLSKIMNVIENNSSYQQHYQKYHTYLEQIKSLTEQQKEQQKNLEKIKDKRRIVVHDPFSKESLTSIDNQIKDTLSTLQNCEEEIKQIKRNLSELINRNIKLHTIILEKEKYEAKLPFFYQDMEEFKKLLEEKHQVLLDYSKDLNALQVEINDLKELINENNPK